MMRLILSLALVVCAANPALAQLGKDLGEKSQVRGSDVNLDQVASALKQTLFISASHATGRAGVPNGFWGNDFIRIPLPGQMSSLDKGLRTLGQGLEISKFQLSMNRAAEQATPSASTLLKTAITNLTFTDSRQVLNGSNTAVTDYLRQTWSAELARAFRPAVEAAMNSNGVIQHYNLLVIQMKGLTFGQVAPLDITSYTLNRTMEGLFSMMGEEEKRIRTNSEPQATPLLRQVFAKN